MTAGHLIADGDFSLLSDVNADCLIDAGRQLVVILSGEDTRLNDDTVFTVRNLERGISDLSCLLTKNRAEQTFLGRKLGLALRRNLADQDIAGTDLGTDADDAALIQILQRVIADAGYILGDLLRSEFCVTGFTFIFLNVNGCIYVIADHTF